MNEHTPLFRQAPHMVYALHPEKVRAAIKLARPLLATVDFTAFAFRGMSGSLLAGAFAFAFKKNLILVRKDNSDSHSQLLVEGDYNTKRYVIVDDFISSGDTVHAIRYHINKEIPEAKCAGILEVANLFHGYQGMLGASFRTQRGASFRTQRGALTQFAQDVAQLGQGGDVLLQTCP